MKSFTEQKSFSFLSWQTGWMSSSAELLCFVLFCFFTHHLETWPCSGLHGSAGQITGLCRWMTQKEDDNQKENITRGKNSGGQEKAQQTKSCCLFNVERRPACRHCHLQPKRWIERTKCDLWLPRGSTLPHSWGKRDEFYQLKTSELFKAARELSGKSFRWTVYFCFLICLSILYIISSYFRSRVSKFWPTFQIPMMYWNIA